MAYLGPDHFFTAVIRVFNPYIRDPDYDRISINGAIAGPSLALYPEGGAMVPGTVNKVVVRSTGQGGKECRQKSFSLTRTAPSPIPLPHDATGLASVNIIPSKTGTLVAVAHIASGEVRAEIAPYSRSDYSLAFSGDRSRNRQDNCQNPR